MKLQTLTDPPHGPPQLVFAKFLWCLDTSQGGCNSPDLFQIPEIPCSMGLVKGKQEISREKSVCFAGEQFKRSTHL